MQNMQRELTLAIDIITKQEVRKVKKFAMLLLAAFFAVPFFGIKDLSNEAYGYCAGPGCSKGAVFHYTYGGPSQTRVTTPYGTIYTTRPYRPYHPCSRPNGMSVSIGQITISHTISNGRNIHRTCVRRGNYGSIHPRPCV